MNKFEILQYKYNRDVISRLEENRIDVNGTLYDADYLGLVRIAVLLAKEVGLGGCKSISEFVEMINQEDPILIDAFSFELSMLNASRNADEKESKDIGDPDDDISFDEEVERMYPEKSTHVDLNTAPKHVFEKHGRKHSRKEPEDKAAKVNKPKESTSSQTEAHNAHQRNQASNVKIENYVLNHGCPRGELKEYKEKVATGKINIPNYDFSRINTKDLVNSSPDDFKNLLADMDEYKNSGKNFKMQLSDFGKHKD